MAHPARIQLSVASSNDEVDRLIEAHQAAIDAWYERWTSAHKDRVAELAVPIILRPNSKTEHE